MHPAQIQAFHVGIGGAAGGQFEGEVGSAGEAQRVLGHQLNPARGFGQEGQRAGTTPHRIRSPNGAQTLHDEAQIVEERQPGHHRGLLELMPRNSMK